MGRKSNKISISREEAHDKPLDLRAALLTLPFRTTRLHLSHKLFDVLVRSNLLVFGGAESTCVQLGELRVAGTRREYNPEVQQKHKP